MLSSKGRHLQAKPASFATSLASWEEDRTSTPSWKHKIFGFPICVLVGFSRQRHAAASSSKAVEFTFYQAANHYGHSRVV